MEVPSQGRKAINRSIFQPIISDGSYRDRRQRQRAGSSWAAPLAFLSWAPCRASFPVKPTLIKWRQNGEPDPRIPSRAVVPWVRFPSVQLGKGFSTPPRSRKCWGLKEGFPLSFLEPCAQAQWIPPACLSMWNHVIILSLSVLPAVYGARLLGKASGPSRALPPRGSERLLLTHDVCLLMCLE